MQQVNRRGISRRSFLKGLGALALTALPACRRAQQFAIEPEGCPEWQLPGESTAFATSMPWPTGSIPVLAVCHQGLPTMLHPNPHYASVRSGLPAFVQASLLDLYTPRRPAAPTFNGRPYPSQGIQGAFRAWSTALKEGRRVAFLFPAGYSPLRMAQVEALRQYRGTRFYAYDPVAEARAHTFPALDTLTDHALGKAVKFDTGMGSLTKLTEDLPEVEILFIFTPADAAGLHPAFAAALQHTQAETIRFCSLEEDHTARLCRYTVPQTHFLEEWGADADAYGNLCLRQPVTLPLRPAVSEAEALHSLLSGEELPMTNRPDISPARQWLLRAVPEAESALRQGIIPGKAPIPQPLPPAAPSGNTIFYLHPFYADGRFAHNPWLQETRFPLTGYAGAAEAFVPGTHNVCAVQVNSHTLPAVPEEQLQHICLPLCPQTLNATTPIIRQEIPSPHRPAKQLPPLSIGSPLRCPNADRPQWALVIDLSRCNGCSACTLACRAENNVPIVGAAELARDRDLQWLRIECYTGPHQHRVFVPTACRQCENAPCEAVCPVHATVHTDEGLNAMVYPRCWGTRYCSAACPYEARTFNFRDYARQAQATTALPANPQVSIRSRGVMEKCTYCLQRLNAARRNNTTPQTACQQACPHGAIRLIDLRHEAPESIITSFDAPNTTPRTLYTGSDTTRGLFQANTPGNSATTSMARMARGYPPRQ